MVSLDFRTRTEADIRPVDTRAFFDEELPALIDERAVHTRGAVTFEDRRGAPLDLARSFAPEDDDDEIAAFLASAGFLHLRGWFDTDAMDEISADMDRAFPSYTRDDGRSWW